MGEEEPKLRQKGVKNYLNGSLTRSFKRRSYT